MICYDCGHPIEDDKPHNHNTFVIIRGEKQALVKFDSVTRHQVNIVGQNGKWISAVGKSVPVICVVTQNESE